MVVFLFTTVIYVFLLLCLCILIVPAGTLSATVTEILPYFFLSCKANAKVKPAKKGHGPHSSKVFCVVLFVLCRSVNCLSANVYCTTATGWLPNCS